jgi:hypothetical protein
MSVRYQLRIRNADGSIARELPATKNLIMDTGLDAYASHLSADLFRFACVGTGTDPVVRYSAPAVVSQAGGGVNNCTSDIPFFQPTDVGKILKIGAQGSGSAGAEQYITAYLNSQTVTTSSSTVFTSQPCAIWYVDQTTLQTQSKSTQTYTGSGNDTVDTVGAGILTRTYTRVFVFSAEVGTVTYNEVGWSWDGTNIYGRDLILPAGITLAVTQQLEVTLQVSFIISPTQPTPVADVSGGLWDTSGNSCVEFVGTTHQLLATILPDGSIDTGIFGYAIEPKTSEFINAMMIQGAWTQVANILVGANPNANAQNFIGLTPASYVPGSFSRDALTTIGLGSLNGITWTGIGVGSSSGNPSWNWSLQFTTPNSKDSSHTLSFTITLTWGRILVN